MSVALFLDVDNTLTLGPIQETFARLLKVDEKYQKIEADWELTRRCDDTEICSPYAGWTIWIKPDVVRAFELFAVSRKRISTIGSKAGR
jgi:hypothetical protein